MIDKKQLKVYSIKIADLILRTVAECENIAKELCKIEKIKFRDKNNHVRKVVNFNEYIEGIDQKYNLQQKLVSFQFENKAQNTFSFKHQPFEKVKKKIDGKERNVWNWYFAYNKIKHDRINNYKEANVENLINALAALFLLNVYYKNQIFYSEEDGGLQGILNQIQSFSDVFEIDYTLKDVKLDDFKKFNNTFFNPGKYFKIIHPFSVYIIEFDKEIKTNKDKGADILDKLESSILIADANGNLIKKHKNYEFSDNKTKCSIVAYLNKV